MRADLSMRVLAISGYGIEMISKRPDVPQVLPHPPAPLSLEQTGLSLDLLLQLTLKHMHFAGELTGTELVATAWPEVHGDRTGAYRL